jgi:hypothetical protein
MQEPNKKGKKNKKKELSLEAVPSLSSVKVQTKEPMSLEDIKINLFNSINNAELEKGLDKWSKQKDFDDKIAVRDLSILKNTATEYLDTFMIFGYNTEGERIVIQYYKSPRDRDAIMEFLKTIFIQQQQNNLLD